MGVHTAPVQKVTIYLLICMIQLVFSVMKKFVHYKIFLSFAVFLNSAFCEIKQSFIKKTPQPTFSKTDFNEKLL